MIVEKHHFYEKELSESKDQRYLYFTSNGTIIDRDYSTKSRYLDENTEILTPFLYPVIFTDIHF